MSNRTDASGLAAILAVLVGIIVMLLLALAVYFSGGFANARPNEAWQAQKVQAEAEGDAETLRRLRYIGTAGTLPCPEGSATWCVPSVGVHQNCCGEGDAYEADDFEVDAFGNLYAILTCNSPRDCEEIPNKVVRHQGEKFRIPPGKVLLNHDPVNDTGHGWVWISPSSTDENGQPVVFCFAPGAGG